MVEKDENETDFRKILNFGHTFAHAYEASLNYSKKLNHGEAVILGMKSALRFSNKNKILSLKDYNLIKKHLDYSFLPSNINKFFSKKDINKIISFMMKDKKNDSSKISLVLLKKIGKPIINQKFKKKNII